MPLNVCSTIFGDQSQERHFFNRTQLDVPLNVCSTMFDEIKVKRGISQDPIAMAKNAAGAGICVAVAKLSR